MPIVFISPKKRRRQLISFLVGITALFLVLIIWRVFLTKPKVLIDFEEKYKLPEIEIDFEFLDSETLEKLQPFEKVSFLEEEKIGRENPFVIYQISSEEEGETSSEE